MLGDRWISEIHGAALSGCGRWLATSHGEYVDNHAPYPDLCLRLWDLTARGLHRRIVLDATMPPRTLAFTPRDELLAISSLGPITIWSVALADPPAAEPPGS